MLMLRDREGRGRGNECPVYGQSKNGSMVPGYVQGGTRASPVKCRGKAGVGGCLGYSKCLCSPIGVSGGRASAQNAQSRGPCWRSHPKATSMQHQSHPQAIYEPPTSHLLSNW